MHARVWASCEVVVDSFGHDLKSEGEGVGSQIELLLSLALHALPHLDGTRPERE